MSQKALPFSGFGQFGILTAEWMQRAMSASRRALRVGWAIASLASKPLQWVRVRQRTIADRLGYAVETVRAALRELRELGLVEARERWHPDGGQGASEYRLLFRRVEEAPEPVEEAPEPVEEEPEVDAAPALRHAIVQWVQSFNARRGTTGWEALHNGDTIQLVTSYLDTGRPRTWKDLTLSEWVLQGMHRLGWSDLRRRALDRILRSMSRTVEV